jgi:hypothetical protein
MTGLSPEPCRCAATRSCAHRRRLSVGLLAQERRDLDLVHAVARQRIHLGAAVRPLRQTLGVVRPE